MRLHGENEKDLPLRTRKFALRIIRVYSALPKSGAAAVMGMQLLRSGTSVGAHVAEAAFAKSTPDFVSKLQGALQELEETCYWIDLLVDAELIPDRKLEPLKTEAREMIAIMVTISNRCARLTKPKGVKA